MALAMVKLQSIEGFALFVGYLAAGIVMLGAFTALYKWRTPYDDLADIRAGKMGPAVMQSGAMIGFVIPLLAASYVGASFLEYVAWTAIASVMQFAWYEVGFRVWKGGRADPYNVASATVMAAGSLCVGLIQAFSMIP